MITAELLKQELDGYVERTYRIRSLSSAHSDAVGSAEGYSRELRARYQEIDTLAKKNRSLLSKTLYPILSTNFAQKRSINNWVKKYTVDISAILPSGIP